MNKQVADNLDKIITALEDDAGSRPGSRRCPLNTRPARGAAARRHQLTRARAIQALRELDRSASPLPSPPSPAQPASPGPGSIPSPTSATRSGGSRDSRPGTASAVPALQRATDSSLRARLTAALTRNQALADENTRLRRQLARALGDQRSPRTRSGNDPAR